MTVFHRGLQIYLLALSVIAAVTIIWGTNQFVLGNTTDGTGWPLMAVVAAALVLLGVVLHQLHGSADDPLRGPYPWSQRD